MPSSFRQLLLDNLLEELASVNLPREDLLSLLVTLLLSYKFSNSVYQFIYRFLERRKK